MDHEWDLADCRRPIRDEFSHTAEIRLHEQTHLYYFLHIRRLGLTIRTKKNDGGAMNSCLPLMHVRLESTSRTDMSSILGKNPRTTAFLFRCLLEWPSIQVLPLVDDQRFQQTECTVLVPMNNTSKFLLSANASLALRMPKCRQAISQGLLEAITGL